MPLYLGRDVTRHAAKPVSQFVGQDFGCLGMRTTVYGEGHFNIVITFIVKRKVKNALLLAIFIGGETTAEMDLTLDFESIDGIWMILGLPVLFILVFLLLSPISFFIHAVLSGSYRKKN